jgi:hypothetical protein
MVYLPGNGLLTVFGIVHKENEKNNRGVFDPE